jgi:endonuclease G
MKVLLKYCLLIAALFMAAAGCNKTGAPAPEPVEGDLLEAAFYGGSSDFAWDAQGRFLTIATAGTWTVGVSYPESAPAGWCTVSPAAGAGNKNVWVATATNNAAAARSATVTVTAAAGSVALGVTQYSTTDPQPNVSTGHLELPKPVEPDWVLNYADGDFTLEYSTAKKHPKWVAWQLYKSHMGSSGRTDYWQFDPRIPAEYSPVREDFSGYDRGHLCPSADRTQSVAMNRQTFMYSNMSPQLGAFNQGIWATLETRVRTWASGSDTLYICAGGTIGKESDIMGYTSTSSMAVPKYYFKVILRKKAANGAFDAIGFWFENKSYSGVSLSSAQVKTIDEIETLTGIDFFYQLPEAEQNRVEAAFTPAAFGL